MKVALAQVDRAQVLQLISQTKGLKLSEGDREVMNYCLAMTSTLYVGSIDGALVCTWGLIPPSLMSETAYLWLFTTPKLEEHKFTFVRRSQIAVAEMLEEYPTIHGHTNVASAQAIQWLRWLGAEFGQPKGVALPFIIRKKS